MIKKFTLKELESLPTISQGHMEDLKIKKENIRVWLSRITKADGMPYDNQVTIENYINDKWVTVAEYQAR